MVETTVEIKTEVGLHARPASLFVQEAQKYHSNIIIQCNGRDGNAKSIISVLGVGVSKGMMLTICAHGEDEEAAINALRMLVLNNFGEIS